MNKFALIPARSGSKGIINKNLSLINGKSLVQRKIENAKSSELFDKIFVSSDSEAVLRLANVLQVEGVRRPDKYSADESTANQVVSHLLSTLNTQMTSEDLIVYLQPTSPFISNTNISNMIDMSLENSCPVVAVKVVSEHPTKMLNLDQNSKISYYEPDGMPTENRQRLDKIYISTGGCYIFKVSDFLMLNQIPVSSSIGYQVDGIEGFDIDLPIDLLIATELDKHLDD